jgi:hypothetical protein
MNKKRKKKKNGCRHEGLAVVTDILKSGPLCIQFGILKSGPLPPNTSAQLAELVA